MAGEGSGRSEREQRRRLAIAVGVGSLLFGTLVGAGLGSDEETPAETVTEVRTVTETTVRRVPVVKVRTVEKVRRVVRTETVTVEAEPVDAYAEPDASGDASAPVSDYAGRTCSEIGHSFTVEPGSDPEHDADNDGVACESE